MPRPKGQRNAPPHAAASAAAAAAAAAAGVRAGLQAVQHMVGLRPVVARRVAAYLEGASLQQIRALTPCGKKEMLTVRP